MHVKKETMHACGKRERKKIKMQLVTCRRWCSVNEPQISQGKGNYTASYRARSLVVRIGAHFSWLRAVPYALSGSRRRDGNHIWNGKDETMMGNYKLLQVFAVVRLPEPSIMFLNPSPVPGSDVARRD